MFPIFVEVNRWKAKKRSIVPSSTRFSLSRDALFNLWNTGTFTVFKTIGQVILKGNWYNRYGLESMILCQWLLSCVCFSYYWQSEIKIPYGFYGMMLPTSSSLSNSVSNN